MIKLLYVGLGGFLGAVLRYGSVMLVASRNTALMPLGTLLVNIAGSFAIGMVYGLVEGRENVKLFIVTGVLGGFTTFSAFSFETFNLFTYNKLLEGTLNISLNIILSVCAVFLGTVISNFIKGIG